jgi:predicted RNase H-like HicB family nuclease
MGDTREPSIHGNGEVEGRSQFGCMAGRPAESSLLLRRVGTTPDAQDRFAIVSEERMKTCTAVIERDPDTGLYVGYVPGFAGAHSQGETLDELNGNLVEVIEMLLEDGEPSLEGEFIGTQTIRVA